MYVYVRMMDVLTCRTYVCVCMYVYVWWMYWLVNGSHPQIQIAPNLHGYESRFECMNACDTDIHTLINHLAYTCVCRLYGKHTRHGFHRLPVVILKLASGKFRWLTPGQHSKLLTLIPISSTCMCLKRSNVSKLLILILFSNEGVHTAHFLWPFPLNPNRSKKEHVFWNVVILFISFFHPPFRKNVP